MLTDIIYGHHIVVQFFSQLMMMTNIVNGFYQHIMYLTEIQKEK